MEIYHHRQTKSRQVASRTHFLNYHLDRFGSSSISSPQFYFQFQLFPHHLDFSYRQILAMGFSVWLCALQLRHTHDLCQLQKLLLHHPHPIICSFPLLREWPNSESGTFIWRFFEHSRSFCALYLTFLAIHRRRTNHLLKQVNYSLPDGQDLILFSCLLVLQVLSNLLCNLL